MMMMMKNDAACTGNTERAWISELATACHTNISFLKLNLPAPITFLYVYREIQDSTHLESGRD